MNSIFEEVAEISKKRENDEIFWKHIDQIKLDFPDENYEKLDK